MFGTPTYAQLADLAFLYEATSCLRRQCGRAVRVLDLKSGDSEFKSRFEHKLDLFEIVPGLTPQLRLQIASWSASCRLGFLTC